TRQNIPHQDRDAKALANIARGGYVLVDTDGKPDLILIATGSEVSLAVDAAKTLSANGKKVRVVSMPSTDVFLAQDVAYHKQVLPDNVSRRIAIEAGVSDGWYKFVGCHGVVMGIDRFGASAPAKDVYQDCGLTVAHIVETATTLLSKATSAMTAECE